jgi:hypothetical protein
MYNKLNKGLELVKWQENTKKILRKRTKLTFWNSCSDGLRAGFGQELQKVKIHSLEVTLG